MVNVPASASGWYHAALSRHPTELYWEDVKRTSRHPTSGAERKERKHLSLAGAEKCDHQGSLLGLCLRRRSYKTTVKRRKGRSLKSG